MRQRYQLTQEGNVLRNELTAEPGADVPEHLHPRIEERFEIVTGDWAFFVDGEERRAGPGDSLIVPPGRWHRFANIGADEGRFVAEIEPAMDMREFFEESAALSQAGAFRKPGVPKGIRGTFAAAEFAHRYRETTVMRFPPQPLQRLLFPLLARIEHRRRPGAA